MTKKGKQNINRSKRRRNRRVKVTKKGRWLKRLAAVFCVMMVAVIVAVAFILQDTKKINYDNIYSVLAESSVILDDEGNEIDSIYTGEGSRVIVDYEEMPKDLVNAFVAIEDKTFWEHHGFNFTRIFGAIFESVTGGDKIGGTSTISQQLARNLWLTETKSSRGLLGVSRKIKEAYYAIQLERHLTKEQIVEAYLNTISLGQNSLGVQAASQSYFSKDVQDLSLLECSALAALPKAPGTYSYIKTLDKGEVANDDPRILKQGKANTYLYNDAAEDRVQTVLKFMKEQDYIDSEEYEKANVSKLKKKIKPNLEDQSNEAQFFVDYTIKMIIEDLMEEYDYSEKDATQKVYAGGLKIHTTLNRDMQKAVEEEFKDNSNFPGVTNLKKDGSGNITGENGSVLLYDYDNYFDSKGNFTLDDDEFTINDDGDIVIKKNKRLNFFKVNGNDGEEINIEFKDMYIQEDGIFYSVNGGIISVPAKYKSMDSKDNVVISKDFINEKPEFMDIDDDEIVIPNGSYSLRQQVQQPQSSMVILDHGTGQIKALVGGRSIEGKMNYNRSLSPRQPGSSIKPIGTYGPAIEMGAEKQKIQNGESSFGKYWTAASVINDEEMTFQGKVWPKNWYSGYRGAMTLRKAVQQSVNTTAVKVLNNIGTERSTDFLRKLGVSTIVDEGAANDMNPAALALGGMTKGISPLEMASAYGTFANKGVNVKPVTYTEIRNNDDKLMLEKAGETTKAMDEGTAFIMTDILRTVVSEGIANAAGVSGHTVAGKTGTTTDNYDAWFVGMTGKYAASLWIGNDVNIELSQGSAAASALWSKVMSNALEGQDNESFAEAPSNVSKKKVSGVSEYFIDGTAPDSINVSSESKNVCEDSGYLSTPWCPSVKKKSFSSLNGDGDDGGSSAPSYYCNLHNLDPDQFPIDPKKKLDTDFTDPDQETEPETEPVPEQPIPEPTPQPTPEPAPTPTPSQSGLSEHSRFSVSTSGRTEYPVKSQPGYSAYDLNIGPSQSAINKLYSLDKFYNSAILDDVIHVCRFCRAS